MKINKQLFDYVLNRPSLLNFLLRASNFEAIPFLQEKRNKLIAKAIEGVYSAGEDLASAEKRIVELEGKNTGVILNYAMETAGEDGIGLMKHEYSKILDCLKNHTFSCVALKPTALIPVEKVIFLSNLMKAENYNNLDFDKICKNPEIGKIAEPFIELTKKAQTVGTKVLIDAEQSNLQPGVDLLSCFLMKQFNKGINPTVYNTYQLYLKESPLRLSVHKKWLETNDARFAAKLVRGAYLSYENTVKYSVHPNYILCDSKPQVDQNYNETMSKLIYEGTSSLVVATHNSNSLKLLIDLLKENTIYNDVQYAFLMGFGDKMAADTSQLCCLEYVPYGPSDVKIPYLLRRLEENSSIFENKK